MELGSDPAGAVDESVLLTYDGPVLRVTLNRPHRKNALDRETWSALHESLRTVRDDDQVQVVVITGAGGDFCAGADLGGDRGGQHPLQRMQWISDIAMTLHEKAKRLALLADFVDAEEAHALGLVTWVKAPEEIDGFVCSPVVGQCGEDLRTDLLRGGRRGRHDHSQPARPAERLHGDDALRTHRRRST